LTRAARAFLLACAAAPWACSTLPAIAPNVCGNGVLDPGEDCDGFAAAGLACRPPGESAQCHLDCSPRPDGSPARCPSGYGCDVGHACRAVTGEFEALPQRVAGNAWSLVSADFDGDGRDDVISQEHPTVLGLANIRAHYFDREAAPARTWTSSVALSTPVPLALSGHSRASLAHTRYGSVGVLTGEDDGSLISEALPSYFVPQAQARVIAVYDDPIRDSSAILVLTGLDGRHGLYRQSLSDERIELVVELSYGPEALAAPPASVHLFEDAERFPCRDVVLAEQGSREVAVYSMCERAADTGVVDWRQDAGEVVLPLDPPASITQGLVVADLDGDGHLDLIVGSEAGTYVAYGDGETLGALQPTALLPADGGDAMPMPLAAGDLSGDGRADLVLPTGVAMSDPESSPRSLRYSTGWSQPTAPFTEAVVADLNRDGKLDAAAASSHGLGITFFNGSGSSRLNPFTIATDHPVAQLGVGDFDGDLIDDLSFVQLAATPGMEEQASVAFGNPSGAPSAPRTVARLRDIEQIAPFRSDTETSVSFLALLYGARDREGRDGSALAFFLGNTDRDLPSGVELSTFSEDGSLATARSLGVTAGSFSAPGSTDLLVLATDSSRSLAMHDLWLIPDIASGRADLVRLGWGFAPDLQPVLDLDTTPELAATLGAGDLNGDGLDEALLAAPDGTRTRCLLSSARVDPSAERRLTASPPVVLEDPCEQDTQLSVVDLDGDGAFDVVILLGAPGHARKLLALWGDGSGELDASQLTTLSPKGVSPSAFALLRHGTDDATWIAYTTADAVKLLQPAAERRFEDAGVLATLEHGTGIVAADVDGDTVTDLVVADAGTVRVLRAMLEAP